MGPFSLAPACPALPWGDHAGRGQNVLQGSRWFRLLSVVHEIRSAECWNQKSSLKAAGGCSSYICDSLQSERTSLQFGGTRVQRRESDVHTATQKSRGRAEHRTRGLKRAALGCFHWSPWLFPLFSEGLRLQWGRTGGPPGLEMWPAPLLRGASNAQQPGLLGSAYWLGTCS